MILEEDEEEEEGFDEMEVEEVENFGPELIIPSDIDLGGHDSAEPYTEPVSPSSPFPPEHETLPDPTLAGSGGMPLTADALAKMQEQQDESTEAVTEKRGS